jgi:hypothetical protein
MRPSLKCAMSMPVTAGSPFGGPAFQSSRPMPWWPIAGPIDVKANVGAGGIGLHQSVVVDGFHSILVRDQNMPFELARGMLGATHGAEFCEFPTSCSASQCSIAFPSVFIL